MNKKYNQLFIETTGKFSELDTRIKILSDLVEEYKIDVTKKDGLNKKSIESTIKRKSELSDFEVALKDAEQERTELVDSISKGLAKELNDVKKSYVNDVKNESRNKIEQSIKEALTAIQTTITSSDNELESALDKFESQVHDDYSNYLNISSLEKVTLSYTNNFTGVAREVLGNKKVTEPLGLISRYDLDNLCQ